MEERLIQQIEQLCTLPGEIFWQEEFWRDKQTRKWDKEKMLRLGEQASICGVQTAKDLKERFPDKSLEETCTALGVEVSEFDFPPGAGRQVFALYHAPDQISLRRVVIEKADDLLKENQLTHLLQGCTSMDIVLAHELFHAVEYQQRDTIFTCTYRENLGLFRRNEFIRPLGEIAAMSFAKELLNLSYNPIVMDCVLTALDSEKSALLLADRMVGFSKDGERGA